MTSTGQPKGRVPSIFGMNFQAVSVGQKLVESGVPGGYMDSVGTPTPQLLSEIQFVDTSIGKFVAGSEECGSLQQHADYHHRKARPVSHRSQTHFPDSG